MLELIKTSQSTKIMMKIDEMRINNRVIRTTFFILLSKMREQMLDET